MFDKGDKVFYMGDESKKGTGTIILVSGDNALVKFTGWVDGAWFKVADLTSATFNSTSCSDCGETFKEGQDQAEVVNKTTGARSMQHAECFAAHDGCCYDLA